MTEFVTFFIIIGAALLFSEFFNRLHLPWVTALIISGIVFGTEGFGLIQPNPVTDFFSEIGLVFLMFMAGLEIRFSSFRKLHREVATISLFSAVLPFLAGITIGITFELSPLETFLLAATLISSSIAVVVPSLESAHIFRKKLGNTIVASTVALDIASVTMFSVLIQQFTATNIPLPLLYGSLLVVLVLLRLAVPRIESYFARKKTQKFEQELQLIISVLVGTVILFSILGLQPAEAGFFAGLILSDTVKNKMTHAKLHAVAYGLFIPVFFVMVGAEINIDLFYGNTAVLWLTLAVVLGSMATKFASGWLAGRASGFTMLESKLVGAATMPQLNVPLAVVSVGFAYGLIGSDLLTALVLLSVVTTFVAPPLIGHLARRLAKVDNPAEESA